MIYIGYLGYHLYIISIKLGKAIIVAKLSIRNDNLRKSFTPFIKLQNAIVA